MTTDRSAGNDAIAELENRLNLPYQAKTLPKRDAVERSPVLSCKLSSTLIFLKYSYVNTLYLEDQQLLS
jgi:hypothetical protein